MVLVEQDRLWIFEGASADPTAVAMLDMPSEGGLRDVTTSRDLVLALGGWGIVTVDASTPMTPSIVGRTSVVGTPYRVVVDASRDRAYVSSVGPGSRLSLHAIDTSNPAAPEVLSRVSAPPVGTHRRRTATGCPRSRPAGAHIPSVPRH
jgi:hypothetical protein